MGEAIELSLSLAGFRPSLDDDDVRIPASRRSTIAFRFLDGDEGWAAVGQEIERLKLTTRGAGDDFDGNFEPFTLLIVTCRGWPACDNLVTRLRLQVGDDDVADDAD